VQRVGIIGVGEIGRAVVEGLCAGPEPAPEIFLSPRSAGTAAALAERFASATVCADNQEVADRSDLVVAALRPADREALAGLRVDADKTVVNVMAGVRNDELRRILGTDAALVQAIPLPTVRERRSVTIVHPSHPEVDALFDLLGGAQPVAEEDFDVFSAVTGTLTTHLSYLATLAAWVADQGVDPEVADRYVRSLFQGLSRATGDGSRTLQRLAADHETPGGNNEHVRTTWFTPENAGRLERALDALLARLR
jgi:pyrroline-5-carboxylate reductase